MLFSNLQNHYEKMEDYQIVDFDLLLKTSPAEEEIITEVEEATEIEEVEKVEKVEEVEVEIPEVEDLPLDKAKQLYDIVSEVLPLDENEAPTLEWLQEQIDTIKPKLIEEIVSSFTPDAQTVLDYVVNKPNFTIDDLKAYVKALEVPTTDVDTIEGAKSYLKANASFTKLYDVDELDEELDALEDNGKLLVKAKKLYDAEVASKQSDATRMTEEAKVEKAKIEKETKEFFSSIQKEVDSLDWKKEAKDSIYQNLQSKRIQEVQSGIKGNAKATMQLARIYSYYENGSFDKLFEELTNKKASKETQVKVDNLQKSKLTGLLGKSQPEKTETKGWRPEY